MDTCLNFHVDAVTLRTEYSYWILISTTTRDLNTWVGSYACITIESQDTFDAKMETHTKLHIWMYLVAV